METNNMREDLEYMKTYPDNWDGEGAVQIYPEVEKHCEHIVSACERLNITEWEMSLDTNGSVFFEGKNRACINLGDKAFSYFIPIDDKTEKASNYTPYTLDKFIKVLKRDFDKNFKKDYIVALIEDEKIRKKVEQLFTLNPKIFNEELARVYFEESNNSVHFECKGFKSDSDFIIFNDGSYMAFVRNGYKSEHSTGKVIHSGYRKPFIKWLSEAREAKEAVKERINFVLNKIKDWKDKYKVHVQYAYDYTLACHIIESGVPEVCVSRELFNLYDEWDELYGTYDDILISEPSSIHNMSNLIYDSDNEG